MKPATFRLCFLGTGNAFATGARAYSAIHVKAGDTTFLVDCGPTVQWMANRRGLDLGVLDAIFFTHLHGDHTFGLPFLLLEMEFLARRKRPLVIVLPSGFEDYPDRVLKMAFPDVHRMGLNFALDIRSLAPDQKPLPFADFTVQAFEMRHSIPVNGLRFERAKRVLAFSGDTLPCKAFHLLSDQADLFVAECSSSTQKCDSPHITHAQLVEIKEQLNAKKTVVIHTDGTFDPSPFEAPKDGDVIEVF